MATKPCPICRAPAQPKYRPFCSLRCQQVDLGRWFTGSYRVPLDDPDENELAPWVEDQIEDDDGNES